MRGQICARTICPKYFSIQFCTASIILCFGCSSSRIGVLFCAKNRVKIVDFYPVKFSAFDSQENVALFCEIEVSSRPLGIVPKAPMTTGITLDLNLHSLLISLACLDICPLSLAAFRRCLCLRVLQCLLGVPCYCLCLQLHYVFLYDFHY